MEIKVGDKVKMHGNIGVVIHIYKAPGGPHNHETAWVNVRLHTGKYRGKIANYYLSSLEKITETIKLKKFSAWK